MVTVQVNGAGHHLDIDPETPLLWALRDELGLTGSKFGCGAGQCGACTVLVCSIPVSAVAGQEITTIEGLSGKIADAVQAAWVEISVPQCGYCQSGQVVAAVTLLAETPRPTDAEIDAAMSGNLCRCATYVRIRAAIHEAARTLEG